MVIVEYNFGLSALDIQADDDKVSIFLIVTWDAILHQKARDVNIILVFGYVP